MLRPWVAFALALLFLSLYPWQFDLTRQFSGWYFDWPRTDGDWVDSILNLSAYVPLGFLAFPHLGWRAVLIGAALSSSVEVLQVALPGRHPSVRDLLMNTWGTLIGCLLSWRLSVRLPKIAAAPMPLAAWALWAISVALPFFPVFRRSQLAILGDALRNPAIQWERFADHAFILTFLAQYSGTQRVFYFAIATIAASGFVHKLRFDYSPALALLSAVALCRLPAQYLTALWLPWLVWKQFHDIPGEPLPTEFTWIPLAGLAANPTFILRTIATKALLYGGAVWTLSRAGTVPLYAVVGVTFLLAAGEWAQLYLSGRTPESTDPLLAAFFGWLFLRKKDD